MTDYLKKHVVSEALAKELKAAGYPQNTHFGWIAGCLMPFPDTTIWECAAPLVSEIGEQLPVFFESHKTHAEQTKKWICGSCIGKLYFDADTEADARALMWLYLKKNGLLKNS